MRLSVRFRLPYLALVGGILLQWCSASGNYPTAAHHVSGNYPRAAAPMGPEPSKKF